MFPTPGARGGVVLMAGRSEFIEKYFEVIADLHARGLSVATMDWRGQGLSERLLPEREKGHILDFGAFRSDLRLFTEEVAKKRFSGPLFLLTHSMGGVPALQLLADGYDAFAAAVLTAPMTQLFDDPVKRMGARLLANAACALGGTRQPVPNVKEHSLEFEGNILTSDPIRHARFRDLQAAAPNAILREPTYGWLRAAMAAIDDLHRPDRFATLKTPVRIISAEKDELVSSKDHRILAERSALIDNVTIKGALHEILMERDDLRAAYWRAFDEFILPRLQAAA
ncbi:MAG: alpha/beta hydrolase [Pseudomonadota bacterium]|nr:alpha/beta hydrolase [Pseudomonadota bacterium]